MCTFVRFLQKGKKIVNITARVCTVFVQLVILFLRSFIYEEISEWNVNKSANRLDIYAPKVESYQLQLISIASWCEDQI